MSDLIDRQAAIDAINVKNVNKGIISALQSIIEELPSAQPEHATCYLDSPCEYQNINIALPTAEPKKGKWIPVTERLPEEQGSYLVTYYFKGRWVVGIDYFRPKKDDWKQHNYITAWMPLPEPYNKDDMRGEKNE